jgi:hypothetical protein
MVSLVDLWLPIVLSAVLVFLSSSVIHMALRWHSKDFAIFTAEDAVMNALRPFDLAPGDYRGRALCGLRRGARFAGRRVVHDGVPHQEHHSFCRLCACALAKLDLVLAKPRLHGSHDDRRLDLWPLDGRRFRLALAVSTFSL